MSTVWIVTAARQLSGTYDETAYLKCGLDRWRTGSFRTLRQMGTMPLPVDVCTLPLHVAERVLGRPIDLDAEMAEWLPVARAGTLVFWWLLLIYGWRVGNRLAGPWAGRWAVALLAAEPSLLGHAALATTDLASAATLLALAFHDRTSRYRTGWRGWAGPSVAFAAALLAKASAVVYAPAVLAVLEAEHWLRNGSCPTFRQAIQSCLRVGGIAILGVALAAVYCKGPDKILAAVMFQVRHNQAGHGGTFLLGRWSDTPLWYYFPAVLSIKLPLVLLAALVVVAAVRPRALTNWPLAIAAVMLLLSLTCRIQIGVRYVLPVVAFGIVGLVAAVGSLRPAVGRFGFAVVGLAMVLAVVRAWPDGLSYTNGLWGPADRGYLLLADSNYDWGQGLYELADWQRRTAAGPIDVAYFGTDPTLARLDMRPVNLLEMTFDEPRPRKLAVSTTLLYGQPTVHCEPVRRLQNLTPTARTTTFLIFDLPPPTAPSVVGRERAETKTGIGPRWCPPTPGHPAPASCNNSSINRSSVSPLGAPSNFLRMTPLASMRTSVGKARMVHDVAIGPLVLPSRNDRQVRFSDRTASLTVSLLGSLLTPTRANGLPSSFFTSDRSCGYMARQGGHQCPQKSSSTTLPR